MSVQKKYLSLIILLILFVLGLVGLSVTSYRHANELESKIHELETQLKAARDKVAHLYSRWHELELLQSAPLP